MTLTRNSSVIRNDTQEPWEYTQHSGFPISILMVGEALPSPLGGAPVIGDWGNQQLVGGGECSIAAHVNIPAFAIALHTPAPLYATFIEEKGDTPS